MDKLAESKLANQHKRWAIRVAESILRNAPPQVDRDGAIGGALLGLAQAIRNYDTCKVPFRRWAQKRVRGAVIDAIRNHDSNSRSSRKRARVFDTASSQLASEIGYKPNGQETLDHIGPTPQIRQTRSLFELIPTSRGLTSLLEVLEGKGRKKKFTEMIQDLPFQWQMVLWLRFYQQDTFATIGEVLHYSEPAAYATCQKALARLRADYD